jgi:hypothetical protein
MNRIFAGNVFLTAALLFSAVAVLGQNVSEYKRTSAQAMSEVPSSLTGSVLDGWGFEGVTTSNTGSTPVVSAGSATADSGAQTAGSSFTGFHASSAAVWSNPAGNGSAKSLSSNGWAVGDYYQFTFSTTGDSHISITWDQTGSNTGPRDFKVQYSTDGTNFTDATGPNSTYQVTNDAWSATTNKPVSTRTLDLSSVTTLNNQATVFIRLVDTTTTAITGGTVASTGTERVDNFTVSEVIPQHATLDFDGDNKSDFALVRHDNGKWDWWVSLNAGGSISTQFGLDTDDPAPADYDGDGRTDIAVWRGGPPNQAAFYILQSKTSTVRVELFGQNGDRPTTVRDYDGDGKADVSVYRPGVNPGDQSYFFYRGSLNNPSGNITYVRWGANGDTETQGDFDGDGKGDFCVRRNIGGAAWFYLLKSSGGIEYINWGLPGDGIVPCDFDGDGRSDFCVARVDANSNYNTYVRTRSGGGTGASPIVFGSALLGDKAAFGDYDGDGKTDVGIWRADPDPSKDVFWIRLTANHSVIARRWGLPDDRSLAEWDTTGGE